MLVIVFCYAAFVVTFDVVLGQLIPASLLTMYMFFVVAGVFMVFTFTEESARELVAPIKALVEDPRRKAVRNVVFAVLPLAAGAYTYYNMLPSYEAPVELRDAYAFGGGLHCCTADVYREGGCEDYFPNIM